MNFKALWIKFEKFTTVIAFKKFERHNYGLAIFSTENEHA